MDEIRTAFARWGLVRSSDHGILGGVCAGVGRRLGLTPWVARVLFVLLLMVLPGSQFLIYPVLWVLMPTEETAARLVPTGTGTYGSPSNGSDGS